MNMSSRANNTRRKVSTIYGIKIEYESLITPEVIMGAGFTRIARGGPVKVGTTIPDVAAFCAAMGVSQDLYYRVQGGMRAATPEYRAKAARVLKRDEAALFRRRVEGQK